MIGSALSWRPKSVSEIRRRGHSLLTRSDGHSSPCRPPRPLAPTPGGPVGARHRCQLAPQQRTTILGRRRLAPGATLSRLSPVRLHPRLAPSSAARSEEAPPLVSGSDHRLVSRWESRPEEAPVCRWAFLWARPAPGWRGWLFQSRSRRHGQRNQLLKANGL